MTTLAEHKQNIQTALRTNRVYLEAAIQAIYAAQTSQERSVAATVEQNGVGFNGTDARILTSFAEWIGRSRYIPGERLTPRQAELAAKKMQKYWRQLLTVCPPSALDRQLADRLPAEANRLGVERPAWAIDPAAHRAVQQAANPTPALAPLQPETSLEVTMGGRMVRVPFSRKGLIVVIEASALQARLSLPTGQMPEYLPVRTSVKAYTFELAGTRVNQENELVSWTYQAMDAQGATWELQIVND